MPLAIESLVLLLFAIACAAIACRIISSVSLLREFGTPIVISLLLVITLFLYVIPIFSVLASARFPSAFFSPVPLAALFFIPHIVLSRIPLMRLQRSGTSRVTAIERSIRDSVWLGYAGLAYIGLVWLISFVATHVSSHYPF
jgi:hypothetical protein